MISNYVQKTREPNSENSHGPFDIEIAIAKLQITKLEKPNHASVQIVVVG